MPGTRLQRERRNHGNTKGFGSRMRCEKRERFGEEGGGGDCVAYKMDLQRSPGRSIRSNFQSSERLCMLRVGIQWVKGCP